MRNLRQLQQSVVTSIADPDGRLAVFMLVFFVWHRQFGNKLGYHCPFGATGVAKDTPTVAAVMLTRRKDAVAKGFATV